MDGTTSVQMLIDQFELMEQANATPTAPRTWSVSGSMTTTQPKSVNLPVKEIIETIERINAQRTRTQSEPVQMIQNTEEVAEPGEELSEEEDTPIAKPTTPTKLAVYMSLTVKTLESDDEDDANSLNSYEDESDTDSMTTTKSTCYSMVPRSPSAYSTASTGSLDSLLSSLDIFLPELLQASGETSAEVSKIIKPAVYRSRRSTLPEYLQSSTTSKLVPPTSYRRGLLARSSSTMTKESTIPAPKSRRYSLYASKNPSPAAPTPSRPRRSSLSATMVPVVVKSMRRSSKSARHAVASSPSTRSDSNSSPAARYMDYDSSPRYVATKARNVERRRQLEERNRNLASSKTARKPRTPEWQGHLDKVRSRLFDSKENDQAHTAKTKTTASQRHSTPHHTCV